MSETLDSNKKTFPKMEIFLASFNQFFPTNHNVNHYLEKRRGIVRRRGGLPFYRQRVKREILPRVILG